MIGANTDRMNKTLRAVRFLFIGPMILALLFVINLLTSPHHWWVQWAALGLGIAWVISLIRVLFALMVVGGLAALVGLLWNKQPPSAPTRVPPPPQ